MCQVPQYPIPDAVAHCLHPLADTFRLLRRLFGGTRVFPFLGDIPFIAQPPVLRSTGKLAKFVFWLQSALLPKFQKDVARIHILDVMGRSNMGAMYLLEFARGLAHIVADPTALGVPADGGVVVMMQFVLLLAACLKRTVSVSPPQEQECAAATLELVYAILKPCDPQTKNAGVFHLYLHTALAHVRSTAREASPTVKTISGDNFEGKVSDTAKFFQPRPSNASRGESLVNK